MKSASWTEIEKHLEEKEKELLKKENIIVPDNHLDGYKYSVTTKIVDKQSWEVLPMPTGNPTCSSANWHHQDVNFEMGEGIAYLTLNSPKTNNALSANIQQALSDAAFELYNRKDIRMVILRAEGKLFCAGGDPKSFMEAGNKSDADARKDDIKFIKFLYTMQCLPQFTIGLAQGSAMGTGIGLLATCDIVVAVRSARFTVSEVKLGQCPAKIAPFVSRKVGIAYAKWLMCTADNFSADQAKHMGLITDVLDDEMDFSKYIESVCEKVTLCAPNAASRAKRLVQNVSQRPLTLKLMQYTGGELADIRIGEEAIKGMIAVQAKTKPYWAENPIKPLY